ncbi:MAG: AAA family ATPase [Myxococcota bacterium]
MRSYAPASAFVGRERELETLVGLVDEARLVTLLGPGGMGKTRLAAEYAAHHAESFAREGGTYFVDLTSARDSSSALSRCATALGAAAEDPEEGIVRAIAHLGRVLIVLDNVEHVATALAPWVERWLADAPSARILSTSRVALQARGEQVLELGPLNSKDAATLFLRRARLVRPDHGMSNALASEIVGAIDCIPLAVELAASRARVLSGEDIRARLREQDALLRGADPDSRHGSMRRAVLDSMALLSEDAQRAFVLGSVMRRSFTVADAAGVLGDLVPAHSVVDVLDLLVRSSLLRVAMEPGASARFSYFETIRRVAHTLATEDVALAAVRRAHAKHYLAKALAAPSPDDLEDLLAAREWIAQTPGASLEDEVRLAIAISALLMGRGRPDLRDALFARSLDALPEGELLARGLLARGVARRELGQSALARADFERARAITEGATLEAAQALTWLGRLDDVMSNTSGARGRYEEALRILRRLPADDARSRAEAEAELHLGHTHRREGTLKPAERAIASAASRFRVLKDDLGLASALYELAVIALFAGRLEDARRCVDEGLTAARNGRTQMMEGTLLSARGILRQEAGDLAGALDDHMESVRLNQNVGHRHRSASSLVYLATAHLERGEAREALAFLGNAEREIRHVGAPRYEALIAACSASALAMLGRFGEARHALETAERALDRVPQEPSLTAALTVHAFVVEAYEGRDGTEVLAGAEALVDAHASDDSRIALRLLRGVGVRRDLATLVVEGKGTAFQPPSGDRVELRLDSPSSRILHHLATQRLEAPGEVTSIDDIIRIGWPDEKIIAQAALNRAYVALSLLRKKGLRGILVSTQGGYRLSPAVPLSRTD